MPTKAEWERPITNYPRQIYKAGNQNWAIQQHPNGWIYVANNKGLLEFDGKEWQTYPIHNSKTRAVKIAPDGRIYIGGMGQFGYFTPNRLGGLDYVCLSDSLPPSTGVGVIWNIETDGRRIYFQSDRSLFCYDAGKITRINLPNEIHSIQPVGNRFYVVCDKGLMLLNGNELVPMKLSNELGSAPHIGGVLAWQEKLIVVTKDKGLFLYNGNTLERYPTAADEFLDRNRVFCAALKGSLLALGSIQGGVILLNLETGETESISRENGLKNSTILGMAFDETGHLWLGLDNGIACIHLRARIAPLFGGRSIIGSGYASRRYGGKLYLGTNQGLYSTTLPARINRKGRMEFVAGTEGQVWALREHDGKLFSCSDNGITVIDGKRVERIERPKGIWDIVAIPGHEGVLLAGTYSGLWLLRKQQNGQWKAEERIEGFNYSCKDILVEPETNALWISNKEHGICRLTLSDDLRQVEKMKTYNNDKLPQGYDGCLTLIGGELTITSHNGLWHYDRTRDCLEKSEWLEAMLDGASAYTYLSLDSLQNIWYVTNGILKLARYDADSCRYSSKEELLHTSLMENFEDVTLCSPTQAVAGTEDGYALINLQAPSFPPHVTLCIRKVYLTERNDSLVYGQNYASDDRQIVIPYSHNSLRIEYSASNYDPFRSLLYSYKLCNDRNKGEWSEYSGNDMKEFTNLREGNYVFHVQLQQKDGMEPVTATFSFKILPPWYRTWWSYLIYALAAGVMLYYIYHRIIQARRRLLLQQELALYKQQQAFQQERALKDEQIDLLTEEKLQAELRHKSEELIRTTLNIVRKNEMLATIKKEVLGISHSISEENLVSVRRKTLRLLGQIDTNMEHDNDLQTFQTTFDSVHHNFFHKLEEAYPELNNREKLLCAYIKMNLLSKEIAPLMNVSLRGVEISRYRLRKKLGIGEGENLTEFLQQLDENHTGLLESRIDSQEG